MKNFISNPRKENKLNKEIAEGILKQNWIEKITKTVNMIKLFNNKECIRNINSLKLKHGLSWKFKIF